MIFNSFSFLLFFPIVAALYYLIPHRARTLFLLIASCLFYMAFVPKYILVLLFLIIADYVLARLMVFRTGRQRLVFLYVSIVLNLGTLFIFKYFNFVSLNVAALAGAIGWHYSPWLLSWLLPLGLSFHVFQSLSYVVEVYRDKYPPEKDILVYALYVLFFPQLVAGPIERPQHLLPQLHQTQRFEWGRTVSGLQLMAWGFFKKVVIADRLSLFVDVVYRDIHHSQGVSIFIAVMLFTFQLYFDFSGYVDIALGAARVFGITLNPNFNKPFSSRSYAEFWRRWHISLSTWFRDYVYFPLARWGSRWGKTWLYVCILITFLLTGIWHGAGWTYVVMGLISGGYIVVGMITSDLRKKIVDGIGLSRVPRLHHALQVVITFSLVSFAWIFFRAPNMTDALYAVRHLFDWGSLWAYLHDPAFIGQYVFMGYRRTEMWVALASVAIALVIEKVQTDEPQERILRSRSLFLQAAFNTVLIMAIIVYGLFQAHQFIYFQF